MCIKNQTHCSVESVAERRQQPLDCRQSVNRSTGCRNLKHLTRLPRASEDRGTPFHPYNILYVPRASEDRGTPFHPYNILYIICAQHIIYNTNRAVWSPLVLRKLLSNTYPGVPLPLPGPPKKNIHNLPKNASPSRPPHHQCADPGTDSLSRPHLRINCADLVEDSCRDE
jgi:hypothetical protein